MCVVCLSQGILAVCSSGDAFLLDCSKPWKKRGAFQGHMRRYATPQLHNLRMFYYLSIMAYAIYRWAHAIQGNLIIYILLQVVVWILSVLLLVTEKHSSSSTIPVTHLFCFFIFHCLCRIEDVSYLRGPHPLGASVLVTAGKDSTVTIHNCSK